MNIPSHPFRKKRLVLLLVTAFFTSLAPVAFILALFATLLAGKGILSVNPLWMESAATLLWGLTIVFTCKRLAKDWYASRMDFSEAEHFVILFALLLGISTMFASANFTVYLVNPTAFVVDDKVTVELKDRLIAALQKFEGRANFFRKIEQRLLAATTTEFSYRDRSAWWGHKKYIVAVGSNLRITFSKMPADRYDPSPHWNALYEFEDRNETMGVNLEPESKEFGLMMLRGEVKNLAEAQETDGVKPTQDYLYRLDSSERGLRSVPFSLFYYQEVMSALGSNPTYFRPAAFWPRFLAFLSAVTKYAYAGCFVSLIVMKRWARSVGSPTTNATIHADKALAVLSSTSPQTP